LSRASTGWGLTSPSVFPGIHNLAIWQALLRSKLRLIGVRHEQTAVYAADGYARTHRKLGVALVTAGPGAANTLAATGEAWEVLFRKDGAQLKRRRMITRAHFVRLRGRYGFHDEARARG
jgi:hypothetical protein